MSMNESPIVNDGSHALDLGTLTAEDFNRHVGEPYALCQTGNDTTLWLASVTTWGRGKRQPFTLTFRGPHQPILPQCIYTLENPCHGCLSIFLVPIGPDEVGMKYEAVFS
jgi:hypothetical protein